MQTENIILLIIGILILCVSLSVLIIVIVKKNRNDTALISSVIRNELEYQQNILSNISSMLSESQRNFSQTQTEKLESLEKRLQTFSIENEQKLEQIRNTVQAQLSEIRYDNTKRLDAMRETVDEKLQKTLDEKFNISFERVNKSLEEVHKGLGEMQSLAIGVGDLKKVLSNVKTRGILGEIQLGAILSDILSPEQYCENIAVKKGSKNFVEFAVKLPGDNDKGFIYLPIDSKFPGDTYASLRNAIECGDKSQIEAAEKRLISTIKSEAKDIRDKYIDPPNTTDFAIMFLPFEGLYCEVVNRGLVEILQHDYKINVAGPSTMAALLNSLQMGFKTLAVQKRSTEVWQILSDVKKEFDTFNKVLESTQNRLHQANEDLDKLVGVRTRKIQSKLNGVQNFEEFM